MPQHLTVLLGRDKDLLLKFRLRDTPVTDLWVERIQSRDNYPLDNPDRFYGFGTQEQEQDRAVSYIQRCVATINSHETIIHRPFEYTQDCLNYLHSIFERYHGLLDQQNTDYWNRAPVEVRKALAELNLAVHRCETVANGIHPKFVCTWFGMPKTHCIDSYLQDQFNEQTIQFGTVYLNYCEIGKTTEDLSNDNDKYIANDAFKPFSHYSADFNVRFYDQDLIPSYSKIQKYIDEHRDFFLAHGITNVYNIKARPIRLPVADLIYDGNRAQILSDIATRQWIHKVTIE